MGLSFFASLMRNQYLFDSVKMFILGTFLETGRRVCQWLIERFKICALCYSHDLIVFRSYISQHIV